MVMPTHALKDMPELPDLNGLKVGDKAAKKIYGPEPGTEGYLPDHISSFGLLQLAQSVDNTIPWSHYPLYRDQMLRRYYKTEPMMSGAAYSVTAKTKALRWKLVDGGRNTKKRFQDIFGNANDGEGMAELIGKTALDLITQDNGAFWLLDGPGNPLKQLPYVTGLVHLDSQQCWRTHDRDYPVIYNNPYTGQFHKLHRSRVVRMSSFAQPDELGRSVGFCAVSRALKLMNFMRSVITYKEEKVSGNFKRAIIFGQGYTTKTFDTAVRQADEKDDSKGLTHYRGIPVLLSLHDKAMMDMLDLASLPDGFEYESELTMYIYALALIFGVDAREFWPATSSGATKADATIQHLKAQGKGFADLIQIIEHAINWYILPRGIEFQFDYTDDEQDLRVEQVRTAKQSNIEGLLRMGVIDQRGAQILCVYRGVMDAKELAAISQATTLVDTEEADSDAPLGPEGDPMLLPPLPIQQEPEPPDGEPPDDEDEEEGQERGQKASPAFSRFRTEKDKYAGHLVALLTKWGEGLANAVSPFDDLDNRLDDLITDYLSQMRRYTSYAYRQGSNGNPVSKASLEQLRDVGKTSEKYFRESFIPDLKTAILATRETGEKDLGIMDAIGKFTGRIKQYANTFWQSIWVGMGGAAPRDRQVKRQLDPTVKNCPGCKEKAKTYKSFNAMMDEAGLPGDGSTPCLGHCHCYILIEQEDGSFTHLPGKGASISYAPLW